MQGRSSTQRKASRSLAAWPRVGSPPASGTVNKEDLGTQVIEGLVATGTRTTTTIAAGSIGNEQPILIVSEQWFSPDLKVLVMTKHSDPRSGETIYRLTNIVQAEPARSLFEVPADYRSRMPSSGVSLRWSRSLRGASPLGLPTRSLARRSRSARSRRVLRIASISRLATATPHLASSCAESCISDPRESPITPVFRVTFGQFLCPSASSTSCSTPSSASSAWGRRRTSSICSRSSTQPTWRSSSPSFPTRIAARRSPCSSNGTAGWRWRR